MLEQNVPKLNPSYKFQYRAPIPNLNSASAKLFRIRNLRTNNRHTTCASSQVHFLHQLYGTSGWSKSKRITSALQSQSSEYNLEDK